MKIKFDKEDIEIIRRLARSEIARFLSKICNDFFEKIKDDDIKEIKDEGQ